MQTQIYIPQQLLVLRFLKFEDNIKISLEKIRRDFLFPRLFKHVLPTA